MGEQENNKIGGGGGGGGNNAMAVDEAASAKGKSVGAADPRLQGISDAIRVVPHFPKPGIMFNDITELLLRPGVFKDAVDMFVERYRGMGIAAVAGVQCRRAQLGGQVEDHLLAYVRACGRVRWFMAGMGATAMVSRQCPGRWVVSGRAAPRRPVPGGRRGFLFASVRWSSGIPRIQCQDRRACRRLLIGRGRSIELSSRRDLMSSDCASGTCLVCAGAGTGGVVVVVAAGAVVGRRRDPDRTAAVVHMRCRLGRRDVVALSL
ncbi:uncharacterized protein [Miscanthus floridulus]|uniref:uncharacterized protein isoform X1 n=1 Tax=Miscanthus floridulus TaxID=154761 RepID=UPI0034587DC8